MHRVSQRPTVRGATMRAVVVAVLLASTVAVAKPWNGIEPGSTTRAGVVEKFGEPNKVLKVNGKEILAYMGKNAIRGTAQAQFRMDKAGIVERIDVFPAATIDLESVVNRYGPACPANKPVPLNPCYLKKVTDDFRTYLHYPQLGLAAFLSEDGKSVGSFVFQADMRQAREAQR